MLESSSPTHGDLARRLTTLADTLKEHTREEEVSDLYVWLPVEFRELRGELRELRAQHAPLVAALRALAEEVPRADEVVLNSELSIGIRETVADLRAHETRECRVVQRAASSPEARGGWLTTHFDEHDATDGSVGPYRLMRRLVVAVIGLSLLAIGLAMAVLPGPAFVLIPSGLAVLALEFEWARRLLRRVRAQLAGADGEAPKGSSFRSPTSP